MQAEDITTSPRFAGQVKRYHTWVTLQTQSNAEHSWQVARIYEELFGVADARVEQYIRWHDAGELKTGDLPFPTKSENSDLKAQFDRMEKAALVSMGVDIAMLDLDEMARVKLCDLLEMWEFGTVEVAMGNRMGVPVVDRTEAAIRAILKAKFGHDTTMISRVEAHKVKVKQWTT